MTNFASDNDLSIDTAQNPSLPTEKQTLDVHDISLLEEKLVVKRHKRKLGEVVVRKQVETKMVHLPIRREKLIIEKNGTTTEHITEVDLGESEVSGIKFDDVGDTQHIYQVQSQFVSLETLQQLLTQIKADSNQGNTKVRIEMITDSPQLQQSYLDICDRLQ